MPDQLALRPAGPAKAPDPSRLLLAEQAMAMIAARFAFEMAETDRDALWLEKLAKLLPECRADHYLIGPLRKRAQALIDAAPRRRGPWGEFNHWLNARRELALALQPLFENRAALALDAYEKGRAA